MQYIKKQIEIGTSGHFNECWECDFKTVNLNDYPNISINMIGRKSYDERLAGKCVSETKSVTVTASDLQLAGAIGYGNIPKLYEILTTKQKEVKNTIFNEETQTPELVTTTEPVYPEFFAGEIINVL